MRKFNYALSIIMLGILSSCGGGSKGDQNSVTLTVEPQLGELGNFISLTDSEIVVKLVDDKEDGQDVKSLVSSLAINVTKSVASNYSFGFDAVVLDENHIEITSLPDFDIDSKIDFDADEDCHNVLSSGPNRAQMKMTEDATEWDSEAQEMWDKIRTKGKYIVIKPEWDSAKYVTPRNSNSSSYSSTSSNYDEAIETASVETEDEIDSPSTSTSDTDFDEFLTAYENYINKYIAIMQKAKNGDYSAMTEAATLMQDAQEYGEKLQKMSGSLTPTQLAKFQKLQQKLLSAAQ